MPTPQNGQKIRRPFCGVDARRVKTNYLSTISTTNYHFWCCRCDVKLKLALVSPINNSSWMLNVDVIFHFSRNHQNQFQVCSVPIMSPSSLCYRLSSFSRGIFNAVLNLTLFEDPEILKWKLPFWTLVA